MVYIEQYSEFAFVYDELMDEVDYDEWFEFLEEIIDKEETSVKNILELACGTGNLTIEFAKKNYDIAGLDISFEMLSVAREKAKSKCIDLVLLQQDMAKLDFEVYELDCVLCACDGFNYIIEEYDLESIFDKVYKHLRQGGLFIFDISSYYKLSKILGDNVFGENREELAYIWQNYFNQEEDTLDMELTFFKKDSNGKYDKFEEFHYQKAYKKEKILNLLSIAGFKNVKMYSDFEFKKPDEKSHRIFFVCKKNNDE